MATEATEQKKMTAPPVVGHSAGLPRAGTRRERPFRIVALALDRALGDFAITLTFAATVKRLFEHAHLSVYYRDDRPYKDDLVAVCPEIDEVFRTSGSAILPFDVFDRAAQAPVMMKNRDWQAKRFTVPDLVLTPSMMDRAFLGGFPQTARFKIPPAREEELRRRLVELGVDPDRWFCVMHYREPSYEFRIPVEFRDVDPEMFRRTSDRIIDELGGQVVRLGHPGMTPFPARDGYIDLASLEDDGFMLQLYAIARARFVFASGSGPALCGSSFGTPTGMCQNPEVTGVWNPMDINMHHHIATPEGEMVSQDVALQRGWINQRVMTDLHKKGFKIFQNSEEEIYQLSRYLHHKTKDTQGWRSSWYELDEIPTPNELNWPMSPVFVSQRVVFKDLPPGRQLAS